MSSSTAGPSTAPTVSLDSRFPHRVQIHLHPPSSLPPSLLAQLPTHSTSHDPLSDTTLPVALVWTVASLRLLRRYGCTGSFTGTLPQFPQQNIFLGLPVQLLPEEVVYLVRRDLAVVIDEARSYRPSSALERGERQEAREEAMHEEQRAAWTERQALRAKHGQNPTTQPTPDDLEAMPYHVTLPTLSDFPWYTPVAHTRLSGIQHLYPYPSTPRDVASVALFEHLLEQGNWCLAGLRFGGTFAVYPGDPLRYHSHYTAELVLPSDDVSLMALVANGRLGTSVKKTHLLCTVEGFDSVVGKELKGRPTGTEGTGKVTDGRQSGTAGAGATTATQASGATERPAQPKGTRTAESTRRGLKCIQAGSYDTAPRGDKESTEVSERRREADGTARRFATFNVFSLAWAGFGT